MKELIDRVGQLFIVGFPGSSPPPAFLDFVKKRQIGGVILFKDNCPTHLKTKETIHTIKSQYEETVPFIAVDQEGGRVCRLKGAPAEYRAASEYGQSNDLERFKEDYARAAVFMESLGINLNLAPVCDIFLNRENQCLKERCFGDTPDIVASFVEQSVVIAKRCGLLSCLKHFPGLGAASIDPHVRPTAAQFDLLLWEQREKIPFAAGVHNGADMVMTTHIQVPSIDNVIATGSHRIVSVMLRRSLSFDGPVITDDLTMAGAVALGNVGQRTVTAFKAGHDILLFGQDFEAATKAYDYFVKSLQSGEISPDSINVSLGRIAGAKFKLDRAVLR